MIRKIFLAIIVLAITGAGFAVYLWSLPHKKVENAKGIAITAEQLAKEYSSNVKAADARYLNKAIEVSGTIIEVDKNQDGGMMIVLKSEDMEKGIQCAMRDKGLGYAKGQNVVIKGFCSDYGITRVSLTDCVMK